MSVVNTRWMVKKIQAIQIVLFLLISKVLLDSPLFILYSTATTAWTIGKQTGGGRVVMNRNCLSWTCTPTVYTVHRHCLVHCPSDLGTSTSQSTFCTKCTFLRDPLNWFILATFCVQSPSTAQWKIALGVGRHQLERPLQALKLIIIAYWWKKKLPAP